MEKEYKSLLDYFLLLVKYRWLIFRNTFFVSILAILISLFIPNKYKSTAEIIPVSSQASGISSLLGGYSFDFFGRDIIIPESFRVVLSSQGLKDSLINKFDLFEVYSAKYKESIYKILDNNIEINIDKEQGFGYSPIVALYLSVIDDDPDRATEMANFYLNFLDDKLKELNKLYEKSKYIYIEQRYLKNIKDLSFVESELKSFQNENGIIEISEQLKALVQNIAEMQAEKEKIEIEIFVAKTQFDNLSPIFKNLITRHSAITNKLNELRNGYPSDNKKLIFPLLDQVPELSMKYFQLYRDVEVQNKIFEMFSIQYEQAKMQLNKNVPSFLILNPPQVPTYKDSPKRSLIVLSAFILSILISVLYIFVLFYYNTQKDENTTEFKKIDELLNILKSDLSKIKFWKL